MKRRDDPNQTLIDWSNPQVPAPAPIPAFPDPIKLAARAPAPLVQHLPWDFRTTFPQPTDEAIDAGVIDESDREPENLRSLHETYSRQCLATLRELDSVLDARRLGVDPRTGKAPKAHAAKERLRKYLAEEPGRLEHSYRVLIETYESGFGPDAAQAFSKAIRAWHAGIDVIADHAPIAANPEVPVQMRKRGVVTTLPVPTPLAQAIAAGDFGQNEKGKPIHPSAAEVRAITEHHAEKLIDLLTAMKETERSLASSQCSDRARLEAESNRLKDALRREVQRYAGSFGDEPATRLEAYARRQVLLGNNADRVR